MAFATGWKIQWPLVLGFARSVVIQAIVQAVVSHREMSRLLRNDSPRSIGIAPALGAASSSCSYAAVAITRSIFRKGANFTAAMAFEMASTNLVLKLSIIKRRHRCFHPRRPDRPADFEHLPRRIEDIGRRELEA